MSCHWFPLLSSVQEKQPEGKLGTQQMFAQMLLRANSVNFEFFSCCFAPQGKTMKDPLSSMTWKSARSSVSLWVASFAAEIPRTEELCKSATAEMCDSCFAARKPKSPPISDVPAGSLWKTQASAQSFISQPCHLVAGLRVSASWVSNVFRDI